jgi:hypothetical protein
VPLRQALDRSAKSAGVISSPRPVSLPSGYTAGRPDSVGLPNFASSDSLPGVCPDRKRQRALDVEHRGVGPYDTRPLPRRPGGSRACAPRLRQCSRPTGATGQSDVIR